MPDQPTENAILEKWKEIVKAAWTNEAFRQALIENPVGTLKAAGMDPGVGSVQIHENNGGTRHFVIPARPADVGVEDVDALLMGDANPGF